MRLLALSLLTALNVALAYGDSAICHPLDPDVLLVPDSTSVASRFEVGLPDAVPGLLRLNSDEIRRHRLKAVVTNGTDSIEMRPVSAGDGRTWYMYAEGDVPVGECGIHIPAGFFLVSPECLEVPEIDLDLDLLRRLEVGGAWHVAPVPVSRKPMFTVQDDDGITGSFEAADPHSYSSWGYFTILYPVMESLGLKGSVSLEGRRAGFTASPPALNLTGLLARRIQDDCGWEIQSHSMHCAGEELNCWLVDSLGAPLARRLLADGPYKGPGYYASVSVYDAVSRRQYMPAEDRSRWVEAAPHMVKPYVGDFEKRTPLFYDEAFDVDYHWGEWFRIARDLGINGNAWVGHNTITSHALTPRINAICPYGFADSSVTCNVPPVMSTASRCLLEGQQLPGYKGESDGDNTYDDNAMKFFRRQVDDACSRGGWIVFGLHAYRKVWKNWLPGALVSEGGSYPDEWVAPLAGIDPLKDPLSPPERLGIKDWSEWHPCPGTRLYMLWELLKYARDKGMLNVLSSEGHRLIGNKEAAGYFTNGLKIGQNEKYISGTAEVYPHFIQSADGEVSYYNPVPSPEINITGFSGQSLSQMVSPEIYSLDGRRATGSAIGNLPDGIWIINGKKYLLKR